MNAADCYFGENADHDLLSPEDERELLILAHSGDQTALDRLVSKNQRLVMKIARKYETYSGDQELLDLIQYGNMGLLEAIRKFDLSRKYRLSTYAVHWIAAYVRRYAIVRGNQVSLTYAQNEARIKVGYAIGELIKTNERDPTESEVAEFTGLPKDVVIESMGMKSVVSLDDIHVNNPAATTDEIMNMQPFSETPEEQGELSSTIRLLRDHVDQLPERDQYIILHHYGINGAEILTMDEIGQNLGISRTRVRQIEVEALQKLSQSLNSAFADGLTM